MAGGIGATTRALDRGRHPADPPKNGTGPAGRPGGVEQPVERVEGMSEPTSVVAARVLAARQAARARLADTPWSTNAEMPGRFLRDLLRPHPGLLTPIERAMTDGKLSLRGVDRVLRIAWTIADLAGRDAPTVFDVGNALLLRTGGDHG